MSRCGLCGLYTAQRRLTSSRGMYFFFTASFTALRTYVVVIDRYCGHHKPTRQTDQSAQYASRKRRRRRTLTYLEVTDTSSSPSHCIICWSTQTRPTNATKRKRSLVPTRQKKSDDHDAKSALSQIKCIWYCCFCSFLSNVIDDVRRTEANEMTDFWIRSPSIGSPS